MPNLNITNIPAPRVPFIDERTGLMAREWYRFFLNLFVLTGSGNNPITLEELQIGPPNQPDLAELLIQINQNIAPQYEDQSGDFLATLDTAQLMSMMSRFENAEAAIQGAYLQPVVQTGTIANYNLDGSPTAGGIAYGTGPALAVSAAGTLGQVLTSAGAGTPTWAAAATGTVTSVAASVPAFLSIAGSPITSSGTLAITLSGTALPVVNGGTGVTTSTGTGNTVLSAAPTLSGDVTLSTGNITQGTAAKGFNFTANTQAAGMTSELLNWYEEGTWTPTVVGSVVAGTQTYTWQKATYTRIGNRVIIDFEILVGVKDATTSGAITITGLPFTASSNSGIPLGFSVAAQNGVTFAGADNNLVVNVEQGTTVLTVTTYPSTNTLAATALAASFRILGTTHYYV